MPTTNAVSSDQRSQVHTEVRRPLEAVIIRVIWFVFGTIEVLIAVRFVLALLGANAATGFVQFIYGVSGIFMAPFISILGTQKVAGATFEWSALVAIAVYALVAWGLTALVRAVSPRAHVETVDQVVSNDGATASH